MHSNVTTIDSDTTPADPIRSARNTFTLTILHHPNLDRVGQTSVIKLRSGAEPITLSRSQPEFRFPGQAAESLADPYVSRKPLELVLTKAGGLTCYPGREGLKYTVKGVQGHGGELLEPHELAYGVRIGLGTQVLLLLRSGEHGPVALERYGMVGTSPTLDAVRDTIEQMGPTPQPVLVRGETGTGKELVARALHSVSKRANRPFVSVNLAAVPQTTAVSQLFGHARGAFTGATEAHDGFFGQADRGTLFLDEIGEAPSDLQPLLLRALDLGEVQPVGGKVRSVDVRLVTATDAVIENLPNFRTALRYRISACTIRIPPLRERPSDIATQYVHFLKRVMPELKEGWSRRGVLERLLDHPWPGNTRELGAVVTRIAHHSGHLDRVEIPADVELGTHVHTAEPEPEPQDDLLTVLAAHDYRIGPSAGALGIAKNTLYARMAEAGIPRAKDLTQAMIADARDAVGSDEAAMAAHLKVSVSGLRIRLKELGLR